MSVLRASRARRGSALVRLAFAVLAMVQLVVVAIAPAADARASSGTMRAHVEEGGTRLHHAHVEALCPSCAAQHLLAAGAAPAGRPSVTRVEAPHTARFTVPLRAARFRLPDTRAPPAPRVT